MGIREDVLALADELEGVSLKDDCESCLASGTALCRGDMECAESAHKACAKRLREIVEHDECEVTTVSAYDLLPEDEREAIAWVREQGGLDVVKDAIKTNEWALSLAVIAHDALFGEDRERDTTPTEFKRELDKRLMPGGMEWPRFEDGEPVKFGDEFADGLGNTRKCQSIELLGGDDGVCDVSIRWGEHDDELLLVCVWQGERVKRPALKVVDADGVDCHIGDAVWWVRNRTGNFRIVRIEPDGKCAIHNDDVNEPCGMTVPSTELTHKRPVLDADGVEIRAGDEVYKLEDSRPYTVKRIDGDHVYINAGGKALDIWTFPGQLTHEQPDTWERLEEDAEKIACDYFGVDFRCDECPHRLGECTAEARKDLVRRARKLAERGA